MSAQGLGLLVVAQFAAGAAWGAILMSAFTVAFAIGENGGEGRMSGLAVLDAGAGDAGAHGDGGDRAQRRSDAQGGAAMGADIVLGAGRRGAALSGGRGRAALGGAAVLSLGGRRYVRVLESRRDRARGAPRRISWRLRSGRSRSSAPPPGPSAPPREMPVCWKWPGSTRAPGSFGNRPANESCDSAKASPLPLRAISVIRSTLGTSSTEAFGAVRARAARGRGVGDGDDANARPVDLVDALDLRAGRHQIGARDEIIGRAEIDLALARRRRAA